jgi:hypothetical protein
MKKLAAIGAVVVAVAISLVSAQAASARPAGINPAEYRALLIRSEGLNHRFGVTNLRSLNLERGINERFATTNPIRQNAASPVPAGMTRDEYRALLLRSEGLNRKYGTTSLDSLTLERGAQDRFGLGNPLRSELVNTPASSDSSNIAWDNIGMGMGAALGLLALIATAVIGVRHRGQHGHLGTS